MPSPPETLDLAVVQLSSGDDLGKNLETCASLVSQAAAAGAKLVVLPENFAFFGSETERRAHAEPLGDPAAPIQSALRDMAQKNECFVVAGGMPERSADAARPYNTLVALGPDGKLVASYRKIHLFDVDLGDGSSYRESESTSHGASPELLEVGGFRCGLSICYDLRFPELYRNLVSRGAEILLVPAAFTQHTGKDHWHVLLRARAIESQCYVVAAAQWGQHPRGRRTYGHSLVSDPWGTVIAECSDGIGYARASISRERLEKVRASLPSLEHRRL